ncbi:MAG: ferritin family protein [Candidatus Aenigmatarchaeota archaeon]
MLSEKPTKIDEKDSDKQILRLGIIAELDAINLYEQLASKAKNEKIKKILLDIAKEEKTHVGEFLSLLLEIDKEQKEELKKGEKEVKEII